MYSFNSRIRYSEVCSNKELDFFSIINYFQDCSLFHSESIGLGIDDLERRHRIWLMNAWQIQVTRFPVFGEEIKVSTWAYDFNAMYGYRNFLIEDSKGKVCAYANSIWIYMDTKNNRPIKIEEDLAKAYKPEKPYPMDYASRKISLPDNLEEGVPFPVLKRNLDTNNHVNNGEYIRMSEEFIPENFKPAGMRAEYRKSAVMGDIIIPLIQQDANTLTIVLADAAKKPYTIIEYTV